MKIYVDCSSSLKKFLKVNELNLDDKIEYSIQEIIEICSIPAEEVGFATINSKKEDFNFKVCDGDIIKFFPTIIAG
jgi:hypothetical protein